MKNHQDIQDASEPYADRIAELMKDLSAQMRAEHIPGPIMAYCALLESAGAANYFFGPLQVAELLEAMAAEYRTVVN